MKTLICPKCGKFYSSDQEHCPHCRSINKGINKAVGMASLAAVGSLLGGPLGAVVGATIGAGANLIGGTKSKESNLCKSCGKKNQDSRTICQFCGADIKTGVKKSTINSSAKNEQTRKPKEVKTVGYKIGDTVKLNADHEYYWEARKIKLTAYLKLNAWEVIKVAKSGSTEFLDLKLPNNSTCLTAVEAKYVFPYTPNGNNKSDSTKSMNTGSNVKSAMERENKSNSQYRFTALGLSGSGKTCFMAGMYYKLARGFEGYTLKANDDDDVRLTTMYERMKNSSAGQDRFPVGTNQTSDYSFELQYGYETINQFDWIDYDGNALKLKNAGNAEAYRNLKNDIASSEILYIFVDGGLFDDEELEYAETEKEKIEMLADIVADSCAAQINHFISEYTKEKQKLPPIAIVVTKYDIVNSVLGKSTRAENMEMLQAVIKKAFSPLFPDPNVYRGAGGYTSMVGIIPVSLGYTINENGYTGRLRPINMHLPVYMGIWFMLKKATDFIQTKNLTDKKYTDLLKKQTASMVRLADVLEENEVYFCLNGQTGKFSQLAEGYFDALKEKC